MPWLFSEDVYTVAIFNPLYTLHFGISAVLKNCFESFAGSVALSTKDDASFRYQEALVSFKESVLQLCSTLLALNENEFPAPNFHATIS